MVARTADSDRGAFVELVVDELGAAATVRIEKDADTPLGTIGRFAAQGILAHQRRCHHEVDVRAWRPLRQVCAVGFGERQSDHTVGGYLALSYLEVDLDFPVGGPAAGRLLGNGHDVLCSSRKRLIYVLRTGIELYWLRKSARTRVGSPSNARSGNRSIVFWIHSFSSRRARLAPRQKCFPRPPNAWCWSSPSRVMSNLCGLANTLSSRWDARYQSRTGSFSLIVCPCISTSLLAARAMNANGGKHRNASSTAASINSGRSRSRASCSGSCSRASIVAL